MAVIPNLRNYAAGTTGGCTATLTPASTKRAYLSSIFGFNDEAGVIEVRNALTGTVSTTSGDATVTGTNTLFLTELEVGDAVRVTDTSELLYVSSITSNTAFEATANSGSNEVSSAAVRFLGEFGTAASAPLDINIDGGLWGSYGKALNVVIINSSADCALTILGYER